MQPICGIRMKTVLQLKLEYGLKIKPGYYFNLYARVDFKNSTQVKKSTQFFEKAPFLAQGGRGTHQCMPTPIYLFLHTHGTRSLSPLLTLMPFSPCAASSDRCCCRCRPLLCGLCLRLCPGAWRHLPRRTARAPSTPWPRSTHCRHRRTSRCSNPCLRASTLTMRPGYHAPLF